jgi:hypothetical protein
VHVWLKAKQKDKVLLGWDNLDIWIYELDGGGFADGLLI